VIRAEKFRFNYGRKWNMTRMKQSVMRLPVTSQGEPDWAYMDKFIQSLPYSGAPDRASVVAPASRLPVPLLDTTAWATFRYDELFDIVRGDFTPSAAITPGPRPLVSSTERSNGIGRYVNLTTRIHPAGVLSVARNGSVGESFYQPRPFHASDDVHVFYPRTPLLPETAVFLCALIRSEKYRYGYGRKWSLDRMKQSVMRLPVTPAGEPDWAYIETFIRSLPYSSVIVSRS
jgi:hypothetical protein